LAVNRGCLRPLRPKHHERHCNNEHGERNKRRKLRSVYPPRELEEKYQYDKRAEDPEDWAHRVEAHETRRRCPHAYGTQ